MSAELVCPGCGGVLPECPCRSGLTAGTFANSSSWGPVALESVLQASEAIKALGPPPPFNEVRPSDLLHGAERWLDEERRILFVSPEAFSCLDASREDADG
jgi:hypothetical protein